MKTLLLLFSLLALASCQVKQGKGTDGLIGGHVPVQNAFSVSVPSAGYYPAGTTLNFTLTHPYNLTVTGTPRLVLSLDGGTVYANYQSGSGGKVLNFRYTVAPGDNALTGIAINSTLDLNGGSIVYGEAETAVPTQLTLPNTSGIRIDTTPAAIIGANAPAVTHYYYGTSLIFEVLYAEPVTVSGTPSINFTIDQCLVAGTHTKEARLVGGSGTNKLTFSYSIEQECNDTNGIPLNRTIQLNGGSITDRAGNNALLDFSAYIPATISNTTQIRGRYPVLREVLAPANGTYGPGQALDFQVLFDRPVTVTGTTAYIGLTIGSDSTKRLQYYSGSGSNTLIFRYIVIGGDLDLNGIELGNNIINENTIRTSAAGTFQLVNMVTDRVVAPDTSGIIIEAPLPTISGIQLPNPLPTSGYYKLGDQVQVIVNFTEPVTVAGGTPTLTAVVGSTNRSFTYLSGSGTSNLIFTYTIQDTDEDKNGVEFTSPLNLGTATIQNSYGTNADLDFTYTINTGFRFDGVAPTVVSAEVTADAGTDYPKYKYNEWINVDVTFSEDVTVTAAARIVLSVGGVSRNATYSSAISSTVKRFRYRVQASDHAAQVGVGLTVPTTLDTTGVIRDTALNDIAVRSMPATDTTGIQIDGAVPTVSTVNLPAAGDYKNGSQLNFTVNFSEPVTVVGSPSIQITLNSGGPVSATYVSGSGTSALLFRYTVGNNEVDDDGIGLATTFTFPVGASITDSSVGNALSNSIPAQNTSTINVDGTTPSVDDVTGPAAGTFLENSDLDFTVTFTEPVTVTGTPQLVLDIGGATKYASYVSGSGTSTLVYSYEVEANLSDKNGIQLTGHILNAGTIRDTAGNNADLTVTPATYATVIVDSRGPQIESISIPTAGLRVSGDTLSFTVNYDEAATVSGGTPYLTLNIGGVEVPAYYDSGSGTTAHVFITDPLTAAHFAPEGISFHTSSLTLGGATIEDSLGHGADGNFSAPSLSAIQVIYSEVISWIRVQNAGGGNGATINSINDLTPQGNNISSNTGTVTKVQSDAGMSNKATAYFDGSSSLGMPGMNVKTILIAFRPDAVPSNVELVSNGTSGIRLINGTDLDFGKSARLAIDAGAFSGSMTDCTSCYNSGVVKVMTLDFDGNQTLSPIIGDGLEGRIAEIWILNGAQNLSDAQIRKISGYLNTRY